MRATLEYIINTFDKYNALCFDNSLPRPEFKLGLRYGSIGSTRVISSPEGELERVVIEVSVRRDLPETEYIDTIVHEMIHYYIAYNHLKDDAPHGRLFHSLMNRIVKQTGIQITVTYNPEDEALIDKVSRPRYVCTIENMNGEAAVMVVAKNKVWEMWDVVATLREIRNVSWYISNRAIWERFPNCVSVGFFPIEADKLRAYLTGARRLVRDENSIHTI